MSKKKQIQAEHMKRARDARVLVPGGASCPECPRGTMQRYGHPANFVPPTFAPFVLPRLNMTIEGDRCVAVPPADIDAAAVALAQALGPKGLSRLTGGHSERGVKTVPGRGPATARGSFRDFFFGQESFSSNNEILRKFLILAFEGETHEFRRFCSGLLKVTQVMKMHLKAPKRQ